ncbi:MAG TPA: dTDP-4-dehydrorhamnose 3,5-epimerase [Pyrinomonadaceae bacterium]|nr:dTDP-4-dehydrorhamnose 3,5-epimerase [Pyrinomonadaceae bacterium]
MKFEETTLAGAYVVEMERLADERGFFARTFCRDEFAARGLDARVAQCSASFNQRRGTLRGMHYQAAPYTEAKLVRCTMGAIYDVIVDLRTESPTFKRWFGLELSAANRRALYIPEGLAHGFLTLADESEVFYQISEFYHPECSRGVRWDDETFGIEWPFEPRVISERDRAFPDFKA